MQVDFNHPLVSLNGQNAIDETGNETTVGKVLASVLANSNKGNPLKLMGWAKKMWNCEPINLDRADKKMLLDFVENEQSLSNLSKSAIIELIDKNSDD